MWQILRKKAEMPTADRALPGRAKPAFAVPTEHFVNHHRIQPPFPAGLEQAMFGLGCFWGAERMFWKVPGVYSTAVGYAARPHAQPDLRGSVLGPHRPQRGGAGVVRSRRRSPTRRCSRCSGRGHDPTQGMRQGNDVGTQYRSGIYTYSPEQRKKAEASRALFQKELAKNGMDEITTEIVDAPPFYYAEDYHQQYLAKNPNGYCGLGGTGVSCPIGLGVAAE